ncbi:FHA domain-containing protein [Leeia sp. TBRC 13508]|uniref:FHA domain-containing protein n=1 Tax=Leeia speluncae TaxID=2884804 RepID=A0ABS8D6M3_9NEIS|nr:FHA domain-containing protein [Leeia speluncae]MCB6183797.1 FHA domain-containing protein [Leeia speluncae]
MAEVVFVEVLDTHGKVFERYRLVDLPITIGRDYKNTIIIDDQTVSLLHLSIQKNEDGKLGVLDCVSENGTWHEERPIKSILVGNDLTLRLGESEVRIRTEDTVLPPTIPIDPARLLRPTLNKKLIFFALFLLNIGEAAFDGYWNSFAPKALPDILLTLAPILIGLPLWATIWGIIGRIFAGRALFFTHGSIGAIALLSLLLAIKLQHFIAFAFNAPELAKWLDLGLYGIGIGLTSYFHLRLASRLSPNLLKTVNGILIAMFWSVWLLGDYAFGLTSEGELDVDTTLLPPAARLTPEKSLEEFMLETETLGEDLPEERTPAVNLSQNNSASTK